jgi:uncharacterized membrane protein
MSFLHVTLVVLARALVLSILSTPFAPAWAGQPTFTQIDFPGATGTLAFGVNSQGDIVGNQFKVSCCPFQFSLSGFQLRGDTFSIIDVPGAHPNSTSAMGINDRGDIVGTYATGESFTSHGYLLSDEIYTTIDVPVALGSGTFANAINSRGDIVGSYSDSSGNSHGFLLREGTFTPIGVPGAACGGNVASGINSNGDVVGS